MQTRFLLLTLLAAALLLGSASAAPLTVYETQDGEPVEIPPQAMDYDEENQRFIAHPGWYEGELIHHYKFRMYVPPNYGTGLDTTASDIPVSPVYLPTTDGGLDGVPEDQRPVLEEYPTAQNTAYSDFVEIHFVEVSPEYEANSHQDAPSLLAAGGEVTPSGIVANMPVVPVGSTLEDPENPGAENPPAPIEPWMAWYDGEEAQTFVFETTDAGFAQFINERTRSGDAAQQGSGYESVVVEGFARPDAVSFVPIWHVNQYFTGVEPGVNNGGPAATGQRNVVAHDRLDDGYSPLWQVYWATQLPPGYEADQARDNEHFGTPSDPAYGFEIAATPMFVNCPNIGPHGGSPADVPDQSPPPSDLAEVEDGIRIEGSIPMESGVEVAAVVGGQELGRTATGMMGAFAFQVRAEELPAGTSQVAVYRVGDAGQLIERDDGGGDAALATYDLRTSVEGGQELVFWGVAAVAAVLLGTLYVYRDRRQ